MYLTLQFISRKGGGAAIAGRAARNLTNFKKVQYCSFISVLSTQVAARGFGTLPVRSSTQYALFWVPILLLFYLFSFGFPKETYGNWPSWGWATWDLRDPDHCEFEVQFGSPPQYDVISLKIHARVSDPASRLPKWGGGRQSRPTPHRLDAGVAMYRAK